MTFRRHRRDRLDLGQIGEAGAVIALVAPQFSVADLHAATHAAELEGYRTEIVSPEKLLVGGRSEAGEEMNFVVDRAPADADAAQFDGLVVPGGRDHVTRIAESEVMRALIKGALDAGKPVAAFGEGVALLAEIAGDAEVGAQAAVAVRGQVFAAGGEDARADAASTFVKAIGVMAQAA